jgi:hypothetical protein
MLKTPTFSVSHGSTPAYSFPMFFLKGIGNVLYFHYLWILQKFGMWLYLSYVIKKSMKFAEYAGLLRQRYFFLGSTPEAFYMRENWLNAFWESGPNPWKFMGIPGFEPINSTALKGLLEKTYFSKAININLYR